MGNGKITTSGQRGQNVGLGIDWSFSNQRGLINDRGEDVIHETGLRCTCNLEDTHAGQIEQTHVPRRRTIIGCENCTGDGYIYRNPRKIVGIVTGIRESVNRQEGGWEQPGDCVLSVHPDYQVAEGDRITFLWSQPVGEGQVILRGAGTMSDNLTRSNINLELNEDRLWYNAVSSIWCEDEDGVIYTEGSFELDGSKIIRWLGDSPARGKRYTIKYDAYLEWVAWDPPAIRRDRLRDLGQRVVLRKAHVALVNDNPTLRTGDNVPFCARITGC